MNSSDQLKLDIIAKISLGKLTRKQGQQVLQISERSLRRYLQAYEKQGALFIQHKNRGREPQNKTSNDLKIKVQKLVKEKYFDFNMTHCLEKLKTDHQIVVNRETMRRWCHEIGMVKRAKKRRSSKIRQRRDRMEQTGLLLQMDGSPHHWFGGKPSCLIAAIDDADSSVPYGEFFPSEDTISCLKVLQKIIEKVGIFSVLYTDRAGIFGGPKRAMFSQVKRALGELGIEIIYANSPEAKGRIERLWNTLQDRLIPEMRLKGIKSYERANDFLQEQFLPSDYERNFKVVPENLESAYKPVPKEIDLKEIFCLKEYRQVNRDHTLSWNNELYEISSRLKYSIYKQKIEIRTYQDLSWRAYFAGKEIKLSLVKIPKKAAVQEIERADFSINPIKVRLDGLVLYQKKYYSVAGNYIGKKVSVIEIENKLKIYHQGKLIEEHTKIPRSSEINHVMKPEHLSSWKRTQLPNSAYRKAARVLGVHVDEFILEVLKQGRGFIDNKTIWGVINLEKTFIAESLNQACKFALDIQAPTYRAVRAYLNLQGKKHMQVRSK